MVAGPYGPLVAAGCGLISSILSLFGGGGPSLTDQIDAIIRAALEVRLIIHLQRKVEKICF